MEEKNEYLTRTRISAIFIHSSLSSSSIGEVLVAQAELDLLIDDFQSEFQDLISPDEAEKAKRDFEYFIKLIDQVTAHYCKNPKQRNSS